MAMTTVHIGIARPEAVPRATLRRGSLADAIGFLAVAVMVFIGGLAGASIVVQVFFAAIGAPGVGLTQLVLPGSLFAASIAAATTIWLAGAIGTHRTIRRMGARSDADDRAAFAELNALLARE